MVSQCINAIKRLGDLRDGLLIIGGAVYGAGYIVWSAVAWQQGLGPLPILDAQYFLAGGPPLLLLAFLIAAIRFSLKLAVGVCPDIVRQSDRRGHAILLSCVFVQLATAVIIGSSTSAKKWLATYSIDNNAVALALIIAIFMIFPVEALGPLILTPPVEGERRFIRVLRRLDAVGDRVIRSQRIGLIYILPTLLVVLAVKLYVVQFTSFPQALGGAKPRCATLDLVASDLAPQTASALVTAGVINGRVVRSRSVEVIFAGSSVIVVRIRSNGSWRIVELQRSAVMAVMWCD